MKATAPAMEQKPASQFDVYTGMAEKIDALRKDALARVGTDPHAAHVAHALLRARSAALFAARCDPARHIARKRKP